MRRTRTVVAETRNARLHSVMGRRRERGRERIPTTTLIKRPSFSLSLSLFAVDDTPQGKRGTRRKRGSRTNQGSERYKLRTRGRKTKEDRGGRAKNKTLSLRGRYRREESIPPFLFLHPILFPFFFRSPFPFFPKLFPRRGKRKERTEKSYPSVRRSHFRPSFLSFFSSSSPPPSLASAAAERLSYEIQNQNRGELPPPPPHLRVYMRSGSGTFPTLQVPLLPLWPFFTPGEH